MREIRDTCECGHQRGVHAYGILRCYGCPGCWWFRLRHVFGRLPVGAGGDAWRLVRFECGCTRYVDYRLLRGDRIEKREDGWPLCPACGEDELGDLVNTEARADAEALFCYRCGFATVRQGRPCPSVEEIVEARALLAVHCTLPDHAGAHGLELVQ